MVKFVDTLGVLCVLVVQSSFPVAPLGLLTYLSQDLFTTFYGSWFCELQLIRQLLGALRLLVGCYSESGYSSGNIFLLNKAVWRLGNLVSADNYYMLFLQHYRPRPTTDPLLTSSESIETIHGNTESRDSSINIDRITMENSKTLLPTVAVL